MWNMMCDVMPTISEDSIAQRSGQFSGDEANFEQLMVNMLDERDKLMETLRETQETLTTNQQKLTDVEKERDSLQRQLQANLPQVGFLRGSRTDGFQFIPKSCTLPHLFSLTRQSYVVFFFCLRVDVISAGYGDRQRDTESMSFLFVCRTLDMEIKYQPCFWLCLLSFRLAFLRFYLSDRPCFLQKLWRFYAATTCVHIY